MFYIILICGIFVDLLSKNIASIYLQLQKNILGDFLYLKYVENTGIAFSIQIPTFLLKILTIVLIILIFSYYRLEVKNEKNKTYIILLNISFGLILAGAIGNAIERVLNGKVIDFIGVKYFAVFNLADSLIFVGAIIYFFTLYKYNKLGVFDQEK